MSKKLILDFCRLIESDPELKLAVSRALGVEEVKSMLEEGQARLMGVTGRVEELRAMIERISEGSEILHSLAAAVDSLGRRVAELDGELRRLRAVAHDLSRDLAEVREGWTEALEGVARVLAEKIFGAKVEEWSYHDVEGLVYGRPHRLRCLSVAEGKGVTLLSIRVHASRGDVHELWVAGRLHEKVTGRKPRLALISLRADAEAAALAAELGVELYEVGSTLPARVGGSDLRGR